jgi:hypothetical protein
MYTIIIWKEIIRNFCYQIIVNSFSPVIAGPSYYPDCIASNGKRTIAKDLKEAAMV